MELGNSREEVYELFREIKEMKEKLGKSRGRGHGKGRSKEAEGKL